MMPFVVMADYRDSGESWRFSGAEGVISEGDDDIFIYRETTA